MNIEYGVLGPLLVRRDGELVALSAAMPRRVLALLLCAGGRPVSADALIEAAWSGAPPATARKTMQVYIRRLRQALGDDGAIVHGPGGYWLNAPAEAVDANRFTELLDLGRSRRSADPAAGAELLREALGLWRGEAYADAEDAGDLPVVAAEARRLADLRLAATEELAGIEIDLGRHAHWAPGLAELAGRHPYRERLHAYLILALYREGRQAEALGAYRRARAGLVEELGVEPGPLLARLHSAILHADPRLDGVPVAELESGLGGAASADPEPTGSGATASGANALGAAASGAGGSEAAGSGAGGSEPAGSEAAAEEPAESKPTRSAPAQLPGDVPTFTGRADELRALHELLPADGGAPSAIVITAVSGTAGVGKTALAVHWAHAVRPRFPDGQLYLNLRGFDAAGAATSPGQALGGFLEALGVPAQRQPVDLDQRAALFRSLLAGKRMLILLDNARDSDQVRPLLPGTPGSLVLVTSRNALPGLVAADGARPLRLDLLPPVEARQLLTRRLGAPRLDAEPDQAAEVIARCAGLPLAMTIVAARAATEPGLPLAAIAAELRAADALDAFDTGEGADARTVFSWSYQQLSPVAGQVFRALGLHPGPDAALRAVAELAGLPVRQARAGIAELRRAHLITEQPAATDPGTDRTAGAGRFGMHDLLRAYARERAHEELSEPARRAAASRLLDYYLATAWAADELLDPHRDRSAVPPPADGAEPLAGAEPAMAWLSAELPSLVGAVRLAEDLRADAITWRLGWALANFFDRRGHWRDWWAVQESAIRAAERLGDPRAQLICQRLSARVRLRLSEEQGALEHLRRALALADQLGDVGDQAQVHLEFAKVMTLAAKHEASLAHCRRALALYRSTGDLAGQANALNTIGWCHSQLGDHWRALESCQRALSLLDEVEDDSLRAGTWDSLGYAHHHLGHHDEAVACYRNALALMRQLGHRFDEAETLSNLGDTHAAAGDEPAAAQAWRQSLAVLEQLGHPKAAQLRGKLWPALTRPPRPVHCRQPSPDLLGGGDLKLDVQG